MSRTAYPGQPLTADELDVLACRSNGIPYAEIALRQKVHQDTVKTRASRARTKLGARDTAQAVFLALKFGLIPVEVDA